MQAKHKLYSRLVPGQSRVITLVESNIADMAALVRILGKRVRRSVLHQSHHSDGAGTGLPLGLCPVPGIIFEHLKPCRLPLVCNCDAKGCPGIILNIFIEVKLGRERARDWRSKVGVVWNGVSRFPLLIR